MGALILKSQNALNAGVESINLINYKRRVLADGGVVSNEASLKEVFDFLDSNGVSDGAIASVTSAQWGVKYDGDKPVKLYSLGSPSGDITIIRATSDSIVVDKSDTYESLHIKTATTSNKVRSLGSFKLKEGLCVAMADKALALSQGSDYGPDKYMGRLELIEPIRSDTEARYFAARLFYNRTEDLQATAANFTHRALLSNGQVGIDGNTGALSISNATYFHDPKNTKSFLNGEQFNLDDGGITPTDKSFHINLNGWTTSRVNDNTTSINAGFIYESWALSGVSDLIAKNLSQRLADKY